MKNFSNTYLILVGLVTLAAAGLHIFIILGGPSWYSRVGAPDQIVRMVKAGRFYPIGFSLMVATFLAFCSAYAFSGAGIIQYLPFSRTMLKCIGSFFLIRGIIFIPIMLVRPDIMAMICNSKGVDTFLVATSILCAAIGAGFIFGAINVPAWGVVMALPE